MNHRGVTLAFGLGCFAIMGGASARAQNEPAQPPADQQSQTALDQQINLLRRDLRSQRKQLIAQNMNLTEQEAVKFWPIYDQYVAELVKTNNVKYDLIKQYAQADTLTDAQADMLAKKWMDVDENVVQLRRKYLPIFRGVLPPKQTARFFQIDRRVQMMIDLQLASSLPLIGP